MTTLSANLQQILTATIKSVPTTVQLSSPRRQPVIVSIDGGIGSGKSTTVDQLKAVFAGMPNVCFIPEPIDTVWNTVVDEQGETILTNFYRNPKCNAFKFQMMAYISRLSNLLAAVRDPAAYDIIITERCVETDRNVFEKMLYNRGQIDLIEHTIYNMWFDEFNRDVCATGIVYIRASPETCLARIKSRSRDGESIAADYIEECNAYHDDWIMNDARSKLVFDADHDTVNDDAAVQDKLLRIVSFVLSLLT